MKIEQIKNITAIELPAAENAEVTMQALSSGQITISILNTRTNDKLCLRLKQPLLEAIEVAVNEGFVFAFTAQELSKH